MEALLFITAAFLGIGVPLIFKKQIFKIVRWNESRKMELQILTGMNDAEATQAAVDRLRRQGYIE